MQICGGSLKPHPVNSHKRNTSHTPRRRRIVTSGGLGCHMQISFKSTAPSAFAKVKTSGGGAAAAAGSGLAELPQQRFSPLSRGSPAPLPQPKGDVPKGKRATPLKSSARAIRPVGAAPGCKSFTTLQGKVSPSLKEGDTTPTRSAQGDSFCPPELRLPEQGGTSHRARFPSPLGLPL